MQGRTFITGRSFSLADIHLLAFMDSLAGLPLGDDQQPPDQHYILFTVTGGYLWHYIHNSLLPVDYEDCPSAE